MMLQSHLPAFKRLLKRPESNHELSFTTADGWSLFKQASPRLLLAMALYHSCR